MTKLHLPECWATEPSDPEAWCICDELRACEKRVARAFHVARIDDTKQWEKTARNQFDAGYTDGGEAGYMRGYGAAMDDGWGEPGHIRKALDEARNEVALALCAIDTYIPSEEHNHVLSVIDVLIEDHRSRTASGLETP